MRDKDDLMAALVHADTYLSLSKVLRVLEDEGYLSRKKSVGMFARHDAPWKLQREVGDFINDL